MKTPSTLVGLLGILVACALPQASAVETPEPVAREVMLRSDSELDELLGPVALYPDALIALILPAATVPADIVLAARLLEEDRTSEEFDAQPWDDSVKALAHFPDIVRWLDVSLAWTKQLGDAFLAQPEGVMDAVQRLRARAYAAGTLKSTAEQSVTHEGQFIRIAPANPQVIYVPQYETETVYVDRPVVVYRDPPVRFVVSYHTGWWLTNDCDWSARRIWYSDWGWSYRHRPSRNWYNPSFPGYVTYVSHPYRNPWVGRTPVRRSSWSDHSDIRRRTTLSRPDPFTPRPPGRVIVDGRDHRDDRARDGERRDSRRPPPPTSPGVVTPPAVPEVVAPAPNVRQPAHPWRPRNDRDATAREARTVVTTPPTSPVARPPQQTQPPQQHPWRRQNVDTQRRDPPAAVPQRRATVATPPSFVTSPAPPSAPAPAPVVTPPPAASTPPPAAAVVAPPARQRDAASSGHPWRRQKNEN